MIGRFRVEAETAVAMAGAGAWLQRPGYLAAAAPPGNRERGRALMRGGWQKAALMRGGY